MSKHLRQSGILRGIIDMDKYKSVFDQNAIQHLKKVN
jgi:hypothetical protein